MSDRQSGGTGRVVVVAAAFRKVSPETRVDQFAYITEIGRVLGRLGFDVRELWRDGPAEPREPIEELLAQDACDLCSASLLIVIHGLPSEGLTLLLAVAAILRIPLLVLQWPNTTPVDIEGHVVGRLQLTNPGALALDLAGAIRDTRILDRPHRKSLELAMDEATRRDMRPKRLRNLRQGHEPTLSIEQLSRRSGVSPKRIAMAEIFPWSMCDVQASEIQALAHSLDVPPQTLLAESDVDAGDWRRRYQVYHYASINETPESILRRVLMMMSTRTFEDALVEFSTTQLHRMFRTARENEEREQNP